jgi:hypothetical protein
MTMANTQGPRLQDRRNDAAREALLCRVFSEFDEMPGLCLTAAQAQRLFGLRPDVCERVLATLVHNGTLKCNRGQHYSLGCEMCSGR